ncbi:MAG: hypothetical protein ACK5LC_08255, partial [Coprobacillaceae bacterium]
MNNSSWRKFIDDIYSTYLLDNNPTAVKYKTSLKSYYSLIQEDFSETYEMINDYMLKDGKLTDQIKNMNSVMRSETKNSIRQSYYIIQNDFNKVFDVNRPESIIEHYDKVKKEPYFRWIHYYLGNGALGAGFNKQIRLAINPIKINLFSMRCGSKNQHYNDFINNKFIAITWGNLIDISSMSYHQLVQYGVEEYDSKMSGSMFSIFRDTMNIGDIVLLIHSGTKLVQLATITSEMKYDEKLPSYYSNYRTIEIIKENVEFDFVYKIQSTITTVYSKNRQVLIKDQLDEDTMERYNEVMANIDTERNFVFEYLKEEKIEEDTVEFLNNHKQLIIDGAPGTGKSYKVNPEVKENEINHERVTFYQDYEYHNFVGSILPVLKNKDISYEF